MPISIRVQGGIGGKEQRREDLLQYELWCGGGYFQFAQRRRRLTVSILNKSQKCLPENERTVQNSGFILNARLHDVGEKLINTTASVIVSAGER